MTHLVVMAAGTGGHVFPGLAVAREIQQRGWTVSWLGTTHGMENKLVPSSGIAMDRISFSGLRGKGLLHAASGGARLLAACWSCWRILRRRSADAVLSMGGYVSFPGGLMAAALGKPLLLFNGDASLLLSTRALLPIADRAAFGFEGEAARRTKKAVVTGNPVRAEIESLPAPSERFKGRSGPLRLLVVGGSLGAQVLNDCLPEALSMWSAADRPHVTHQTGEADVARVKAAYASTGVQADVRPFIDDMAQSLADCDVVVCRAGAMTVSEVCAAGVASVLVPLVLRTTAHQRANAAVMASNGAALHLPQSELTPQRLVEMLRGLDRYALLTMAVKARALARPKAAARIADEIEKLVPEQRVFA